MLYVIGALGVGGVVMTLLFLVYKAKFKAALREKEMVAADRDAWIQINVIQETLKDEVRKDRRLQMEAKLKELLSRVVKAKPGDVIEDATGTGKGGAT